MLAYMYVCNTRLAGYVVIFEFLQWSLIVLFKSHTSTVCFVLGLFVCLTKYKSCFIKIAIKFMKRYIYI